MSENPTQKLYNSITQISEEIIEEAQDVQPPKRRSAWVRWGAAAACLCVVVAGALAWWQSSRSPANDSEITAADGVIVWEDGVTIPPLNVALSVPSDGEYCWAYAFFIYQGRCYVEYERIYDAENLVGEHLGTATGLLDVWTPKEGYVDLAGNIEGDFYSVQGYDPSVLLCMKNEDGSVSTFLCNNGITLKTGDDLYEKRLHLAENYTAVQYETRASWYYDAGEVSQLKEPKSETVNAFLQALNAAAFMPAADIPLEEGESSIYDDKEIYHLYFLLENGMTVHLRLFEGGYVSFQGLLDVCVQLPQEPFDEMVSLFSDPDAGALAAQVSHLPTLEDCRSDESFGALVPAYIPEGMSFTNAEIRYFLDSATGSEIGTKEIWLHYSDTFDARIGYSILLAWAEDYGTNGWAGPMVDASELSEAALAEYVETESATGRPLAQSRIDVGVWYGDRSVVLSGNGLSAETAYAILASVKREIT